LKIELRGHEFEVDGELIEGEDCTHYTPGVSSDFEIDNVYYQGVNITDLVFDIFPSDFLSELVDLMVEKST
jgi:hypothetical protein